MPSRFTALTSAAEGDEVADNVALVRSERARASFDATELTHWINGSSRMTALKAAVAAQIAADPEYAHADWPSLSVAGKRERVVRVIRAAFRHFMVRRAAAVPGVVCDALPA